MAPEACKTSLYSAKVIRFIHRYISSYKCTPRTITLNPSLPLVPSPSIPFLPPPSFLIFIRATPTAKAGRGGEQGRRNQASRRPPNTA